MTVRKTCLKCGHTAMVVLYQLATCPRCGALYAKTDEAHAAAQAAAARAGRRKQALLQLVAVGAVVLAGALVREVVPRTPGASRRGGGRRPPWRGHLRRGRGGRAARRAGRSAHPCGAAEVPDHDRCFEAAEPLARAHGEAFVRAVAAIGACRNALLTALTVRRHDGGEFAVFASEDGWVRLY